MNDEKKGQTLLHLARAAIARELGFVSHELPRADWLEAPGATFVSVILDGRLHGCIGSLEANRPLMDDVRDNAVAAAFRDPRYPPLTKQEFAKAVLEVALLGPPEAIHFSSEQDALAQLTPGQDGVTLEYTSPSTSPEEGGMIAAAGADDPVAVPADTFHRATFLPHAWADFPHARGLLARLKSQAGLPEDFWSVDVRLSRFTVQKWREGE